ncbi:MAG: hypothetical protein IPM25_17930 [Chloracidobacterium sp.]|nr:hypothetical protein [Chloracidobacterium sp.]
MRIFSSILTTFLAAAVFSVVAFAQDPPEQPEPPKPKEAAAEQKPAPCPKLAVKGPGGRSVRDGAPVIFSAEIAGGDPSITPTILWSVTAGVIKAGQGERRIEVDSTGAGAYRQINAELWVGGYAPECPTTASAMVRVAPRPTMVDEFGELSPEKEGERIIAAAGHLAEPGDSLQIIVYSGRSSVRGFAAAAQKRMATQLADSELPLNRIRVVDGGYREQPAYELWLVPEGSESPRPTPTIDRREIQTPPRTTTRRP